MKPSRIYLPGDLKKKFKRASMENYGYSRGSLSQAAEEAVRNWVQTREARTRVDVPTEPVKVLRGLLSNVRKNSVQLQHDSARIRAKQAKGA
jgi:hypothetical protein